MALSLFSSPVRFAATVAPPWQVADTVPATDVADCSVISHLRSAQLPMGRPAIDDDPHAPAKADAGVAVPELVPLLEFGGVVVPATPLLPDGAVGVRSLDVFSKAHPAARVDTRRIPSRDRFFMIR